MGSGDENGSDPKIKMQCIMGFLSRGYPNPQRIRKNIVASFLSLGNRGGYIHEIFSPSLAIRQGRSDATMSDIGKHQDYYIIIQFFIKATVCVYV